MKTAKNPIAFNAFTMTVNQLKGCADTLRAVFDLLDRDASDQDIKTYIEQSREFMRKTWS